MREREREQKTDRIMEKKRRYDTQHKGLFRHTQHEHCHYDDCRVLFIVRPNVIIMHVIMQNGITLTDIMLNVVILNVVMLSAVVPKNRTREPKLGENKELKTAKG